MANRANKKHRKELKRKRKRKLKKLRGNKSDGLGEYDYVANDDNYIDDPNANSEALDNHLDNSNKVFEVSHIESKGFNRFG